MRRILVAVDASPHSLAALDAALRLAADLEAEVIGLFVEDINLLRLAGMPFASEVRTSSAATYELSSGGMEAGMRAQAARARRLVQQARRRRPRPGHVSRRARAGDGGDSTGRRRRRSADAGARQPSADAADACSARRRAPPCGCPARCCSRRVRGKTARLSWFAISGGAHSGRALETAAALAAPAGTLVVLFVAADAVTAEARQQEVAAWMAQRQLPFTARRVPTASSANLVNAVQVEGCSILVVEGDTIVDGEQSLQTLLQETDCSLMIVR